MNNPDQLDFAALCKGDRKALSKGITLLESSRPDHRVAAEQLLSEAAPLSGNSIRIGLTGVPGVGKSTFIEQFGNQVIANGHNLAVLAIDPSSTLNGGSILADKTRMPTLATNTRAFIRPSPAGQSLGGVARRTREAIVLCEAAGFDVIIVETVGVGQSETMVSNMTDLFLLMLLPGGGDDLQGIKRGIMELADMVVVNKADGDLKARANLSAADVQQALRLIKPRLPNWSVPVLTLSALQATAIEAVWDNVSAFHKRLVEDELLDSIRRKQRKNWLWTETHERLLGKLKSSKAVQQSLDDLQESVMSGELAPSVAAETLVSEFMKDQVR